MVCGENDLTLLVDDLRALDHAAETRTLRIILLARDRHAGVDRIPDEDGLDKAHAIITVGKCNGIDDARCQPDADRENHGAMGDALAEGLCLHEFRIHVMWEEIAGR